jgi:hypothetical protein
MDAFSADSWHICAYSSRLKPPVASSGSFHAVVDPDESLSQLLDLSRAPQEVQDEWEQVAYTIHYSLA